MTFEVTVEEKIYRLQNRIDDLFEDLDEINTEFERDNILNKIDELEEEIAYLRSL